MVGSRNQCANCTNRVAACNSICRRVTPEAARLPQLQDLDLGVEAPGLSVAKAPGGVIEAKDDLGKVVFSGAQPVMWDSRGEAQAPTYDDRTEAPLEGDKVVQIPVAVTQDSLRISPAPAHVNYAATEYPLHIDPPFAAPQEGRAMINEHYPTTALWNWSGAEGVGYQSFDPWSRKRLQMEDQWIQHEGGIRSLANRINSPGAGQGR